MANDLSPFHVAYWNLIVCGIGLFCLFIITFINSSKLERIESSVFQSKDAQNVGIALLASSFPLILDVSVNFCSQGLHINGNGILLGRACYAVATFLFGLQLALQYDIFPLFLSYETSIFFILSGYRIVYTSTLLFFISVTDPIYNTVCPTIMLSTLASLITCLHAMNGTNNFLNFVYLLLIIIFLIRMDFRNRKYQKDCKHMLYVNLFIFKFVFDIAIRLPLMIYQYYSSHITNTSSLYRVYETAPMASLYLYVLITAVLAVIPGWITTQDVIKSKDQVIADTKASYERYMSHELRNPMNVVDMGIQFCLNKIPENSTDVELKEVRDTLEDAKASSDDSLTILNDFLFYHSIESGAEKLQNKNVNILKFISDYMTMFKAHLRSKNINLELNNCGSDLNDIHESDKSASSINILSTKSLESLKTYSAKGGNDTTTCGERVTEDDVILMDPEKFGHVFRNLLSTAIKSAPIHGTISVNITIVPEEYNIMKSESSDENSSSVFCSCNYLSYVGDTIKKTFSDEAISYFCNKDKMQSVQNGMLVIEVHDRSSTVSPENQSDLFKEIVQFSPEKLEAGGGRVLGLWISKSIVDMHGGNISMYSEGDMKGSTFRLEMPMTRNKKQTIVSQEEKRSSILDLVNSTLSINEYLFPLSISRTSSRHHDVNHESNKSQYLDKTRTSFNFDNEFIPSPPRPSRAISQKAAVSSNIDYFVPSHSFDVDETIKPISTKSDVVMDIQSDNVSDPITTDVDTHIDTNTSLSDTVVSPIHIDSNIINHVKSHSNKGMTVDTKPLVATIIPDSVTVKTLDITLPTPSTDILRVKPKKFLIVDDVVMIRKMLRKLLEQKGHICDEAGNGLIALNMVHSERSYDAIFMDFVMPTMNGPDATRAIREFGYTGQIIGVTGNSHVNDQTIFMNAGLNNILIKPLQMDKLGEIIEV